MPRKLTHEEYVTRVNDINQNINVISKYINSRTSVTHKCLIDKCIWSAKPRDILQGHGCPVCSGRIVGPAPEYKNSIWASQYKEYFSCYMSEEQMKHYTPQSNQIIEVICPDCGAKKEIMISVLFNQGLGCICSDKISFANKFVFNVLEQIGVMVQMEYSPEWAQGKRYDDYLIDYNLIIENHGRQHYEECSFTTRTLSEEQENDNTKKQMALLNGIHNYVVLDCRCSTKEHIRKSIIESILPSILHFKDTDIDWDRALMFAHSNLIHEAATLFNNGKHTKEISEILCVHRSSICRWLNIATKLKLCDYQPQEEVKIMHNKKVLCVELNKIFNSLTEAARYFNTTASNINMCLCGANPRACGYHWIYV